MEPPGRRESETKISFREFIGWTFENNRTKFHAFTSRIVPSAYCYVQLKIVKMPLLWLSPFELLVSLRNLHQSTLRHILGRSICWF